MKKYKFKDLQFGQYYSNAEGFYQFIKMRNNYIAEFVEIVFDDDNDYYGHASNVIYITENELYFY